MEEEEGGQEQPDHQPQHSQQDVEVEGSPQLGPLPRTDHNGLDQHQQGQQPQGEYEGEEEGVVALPHAGTDPGAVVVEPLHAHVAVVAVRSARRAEDEAVGAELNLQRVGLDGHPEYPLVVPDRPTQVVPSDGDHLQILPFVVAKDLGDDARVLLAQDEQHSQSQQVQAH